MRVTQNMLDRNLIHSMQQNLEYLAKLNEQLSSGNRVNTVSDDVPVARRIMFLQRENQQLDTYLSNISSVDAMLSFATSTLETVSETVIRIKELATQAATETYTDMERQIMAEGVDNLLGTLVLLANVENEGNYMFSGEAIHTAPYAVSLDLAGDIQSVTYQGQMITTEVDVGPGTTSEMNLVGATIFQGAGDLFETVIGLRDAMRASDTDEINRFIGELETSHSDIRLALGQLGERHAQLQVAQVSIESLQTLNNQVITDKQGADVAQVSVEYNSRMALLQMVMKVAAQGVKPSILDFL
ncbi:MAG: flagellar hook-associated protein FlgL [Planctomycetota bacterium]|jgi:flagellar hook-associated protein 3 FlgL